MNPKMLPVTVLPGFLGAGKRPMTKNRVSHANNKTRRRWEPNLHIKRVWVPEEGRCVKIKVSARGMRTIAKLGYRAALRKAKG